MSAVAPSWRSEVVVDRHRHPGPFIGADLHLGHGADGDGARAHVAALDQPAYVVEDWLAARRSRLERVRMRAVMAIATTSEATAMARTAWRLGVGERTALTRSATSG